MKTKARIIGVLFLITIVAGGFAQGFVGGKLISGDASATAARPFDIDWKFSPTRWVAVLLLFVLARVFEQGARMREELEGTV